MQVLFVFGRVTIKNRYTSDGNCCLTFSSFSYPIYLTTEILITQTPPRLFLYGRPSRSPCRSTLFLILAHLPRNRLACYDQRRLQYALLVLLRGPVQRLDIGMVILEAIDQLHQVVYLLLQRAHHRQTLARWQAEYEWNGPLQQR